MSGPSPIGNSGFPVQNAGMPMPESPNRVLSAIQRIAGIILCGAGLAGVFLGGVSYTASLNPIALAVIIASVALVALGVFLLCKSYQNNQKPNRTLPESNAIPSQPIQPTDGQHVKASVTSNVPTCTFQAEMKIADETPKIKAVPPSIKPLPQTPLTIKSLPPALPVTKPLLPSFTSVFCSIPEDGVLKEGVQKVQEEEKEKKEERDQSLSVRAISTISGTRTQRVQEDEKERKEEDEQALIFESFFDMTRPREKPSGRISPTIFVKEAEQPSNVLVLKDIRGKLEDYLSEYCPNQTYRETETLILFGASLLEKINSIPIGSEKWNMLMSTYANAEDLQKATAGIIWYFMALAIRDDDGFSEGTFRVRDTEQKLYTFLNREGIAYWRPCSHELHLKDNNTRGIDVHLNKGGLPAEMAHVLIKPETLFMDGENWLMLKPEPHGLGGLIDGMMHMCLWGVSFAVRLFSPDNNQGANKRKERIPLSLVRTFRKTISGLPGAEEAIAKAGNEKGYGFGIQAMHAFITNVKTSEVPAERVKDLADFYELLQKYKHPERRIGEEYVIMETPEVVSIVIESPQAAVHEPMLDRGFLAPNSLVEIQA